MSQKLVDKVIRNACVRGKAYHLLIQLAHAANGKGEVKLTVKELRLRTRSTDDTSLYAALKKLERAGYVQSWGRRHTKDAYLVVSDRALTRAEILQTARSLLSGLRNRPEPR